jgi:hypothetical protein
MGIEAVGNSVFRINHDDEPEDTNTYNVGKDHEYPITVGQYMEDENRTLLRLNNEQRALEQTVQHLTTNLQRDHWATIRYAVEEYAKANEEGLNELLTLAVGERKPGHFEEVAFKAQLVGWCNEVLMHFSSCRNEYGVDL